jgi:serine/threonine protein kinase
VCLPNCNLVEAALGTALEAGTKVARLQWATERVSPLELKQLVKARKETVGQALVVMTDWLANVETFKQESNASLPTGIQQLRDALMDVQPLESPDTLSITVAFERLQTLRKTWEIQLHGYQTTCVAAIQGLASALSTTAGHLNVSTNTSSELKELPNLVGCDFTESFERLLSVRVPPATEVTAVHIAEALGHLKHALNCEILVFDENKAKIKPLRKRLSRLQPCWEIDEKDTLSQLAQEATVFEQKETKLMKELKRQKRKKKRLQLRLEDCLDPDVSDVESDEEVALRGQVAQVQNVLDKLEPELRELHDERHKELSLRVQQLSLGLPEVLVPGWLLEENHPWLPELLHHARYEGLERSYTLDMFVIQKILAESNHKILAVTLDGKPYALKRYAAAKKDQLLREASKLHQLRKCPYIIPVEFLFVDGKHAYLAMPLCAGTLETAFEPGPQHDSLRRQAALQLVQAVTLAHRYDIIHCDIKPANILILHEVPCDVKQGVTILLADWDMSHTAEERLTRSMLMVTMDGSGSATYTAPEVFLHGTKNGKPADVYSLGATLFDLYFPVKTYPEVKQRKVFPQQADPQLKQLLQAMLSVDPTHRPTAQDVLEHPFFTVTDATDELSEPIRLMKLMMSQFPSIVESLMEQNRDEICELIMDGTPHVAQSPSLADPVTPPAAPVAPQSEPSTEPGAADLPEHEYFQHTEANRKITQDQTLLNARLAEQSQQLHSLQQQLSILCDKLGDANNETVDRGLQGLAPRTRPAVSATNFGSEEEFVDQCGITVERLHCVTGLLNKLTLFNQVLHGTKRTGQKLAAWKFVFDALTDSKILLVSQEVYDDELPSDSIMQQWLLALHTSQTDLKSELQSLKMCNVFAQNRSNAQRELLEALEDVIEMIDENSAGRMTQAVAAVKATIENATLN